MGHGGNVIAELSTDHRRDRRDVPGTHQTAPPGDARRREIADRFTIELVRHSAAGELYLYPAVRRHLPDGDALADAEIEDHANVEKLLKQLEGLDATDPRFTQTVSVLITEVSAHITDEETPASRAPTSTRPALAPIRHVPVEVTAMLVVALTAGAPGPTVCPGAVWSADPGADRDAHGLRS